MAAIDGLAEGLILLDVGLSVIHSNIAIKTIFPSVGAGLADGANFYAWFKEAIRGEGLIGDKLGQFLAWLKSDDRSSYATVLLTARGGRTFQVRGHQTGTDDLLVTISDLTELCGAKAGDAAADELPIRPALRDFRRFAETMAIARAEVGDALQRIERTNRSLAREVAERRALERELRRRADTDDLTGAVNRRRFVEILTTSSLTLTRPDAVHALLMMDVDHFKSVNDRFGHQAGDDALRALAGLCRHILPTSCELARLGGEEFAVLLTDQSRSDVAGLAETIRHQVETYTIRSGPHSFSLTMSLGGVVFREPPAEPLQLFKAADQALYRAKRNGRNRVFLSDPLNLEAAPPATARSFADETRYSALAVSSLEP